MTTPPMPHARERRAVPPAGVRRLPDDARIVFLSDSHIGGNPGRDIFESPAELTALLDELADLDGPVELVLAGDFFDFLEIGDVPVGENRASVTIGRPEYRRLFAALRRFAAGAGRRVVYLPGNHDAEMWWNPAIRETLRGEGLVHEFARSYAARFAARPDRIVYCEHGNQFDPANTITDYDDPLDSPLGEHMVTDVLRRIVPGGDAGRDPYLRDIDKVYPLVEIPEWIAGRLFYDLVTRFFRWLLLPFSLAYVGFRLLADREATAQDAALTFWRGKRSRPTGERLFVEIGYDLLLLLVAFGLFFVVIRRQTTRAVAATATRLPGLGGAQTPVDLIRSLLASDEPLPMNAGLTGREVALFVSGHTHAPSLTEVTRDGAAEAVAVNAGCWLRQLRPVRAHLGTPSVSVPTFVLTHVRVALDGADVRVELWEHPKPARRRLRVAERIAILGRLPAWPPALAVPRIVAAARIAGSDAPAADMRQP